MLTVARVPAPGDPLGTGTGGPGLEISDAIHPGLAFNRPYLVAMANKGPGTNCSQFFITVSLASFWTGQYTIFGTVIAGHDVVEKINAYRRCTCARSIRSCWKP
jgi:peptidyl-prolyl cis-trans isomerase A (cyclophilin A)